MTKAEDSKINKVDRTCGDKIVPRTELRAMGGDGFGSLDSVIQYGSNNIWTFDLYS